MSSCSAASQSLEWAGFLWQATHLHFICSATKIWVLPEWKFTYSLTYWWCIKNCVVGFFFPCCLLCPRVSPMLTAPNFMLFSIFQPQPGWGSLLQSNPTTLLLFFKHKIWLKASQCLQLSCFYCKLQWLIKALTLCYHDPLETGKVGEARVFAMTPWLLRSLKLRAAKVCSGWHQWPVGSQVSWEER